MSLRKFPSFPIVSTVRADGQTIRRKREECGYTLRDFADRIGLSPSYLSRVERDQANPSPDVLKRIAIAIRRERDTRDAIREIARHETEGSDDEPAD